MRVADETQIIAASLAFKNQINDIYSCSWGTVGFFANKVGYTPPVVKDSMKNGAEKVGFTCEISFQITQQLFLEYIGHPCEWCKHMNVT